MKFMGAKATYQMDGEKIKAILIEKNLTNTDVYGKDSIRRDSFLNALRGGNVLQRNAVNLAKKLNVSLSDIVRA